MTPTNDLWTNAWRAVGWQIMRSMRLTTFVSNACGNSHRQARRTRNGKLIDRLPGSKAFELPARLRKFTSKSAQPAKQLIQASRNTVRKPTSQTIQPATQLIHLPARNQPTSPCLRVESLHVGALFENARSARGHFRERTVSVPRPHLCCARCYGFTPLSLQPQINDISLELLTGWLLQADLSLVTFLLPTAAGLTTCDCCDLGKSIRAAATH